jgi:dTDP-4-amino-4,6-dideoxygalactose transaminase
MHHGGNPADMDPIREIAHNNDLTVVGDAVHALGGKYKGKKIGQDSDIACFSSLKKPLYSWRRRNVCYKQ